MNNSPVNTGGLPEEEYKPGEYSKASESTITTPEQDIKKEEKIKLIIDEIVDSKLKPINSQLDQMPSLIHDTVIQVINEITAAQQQQPQNEQSPVQQPQQQGGQFEKLAMLAQTIGPLLAGQNAAPATDPLLEMIKGAFSKMIQAKVDETIMGTYGVRVPPPADITAPVPPPKTNIEYE